jgi:ligand-binding SRPBCC domain-containing protein
MRDRVDYALPPLPFANFINSVIVARRLKEIFDYRHQAVEKIFS